MSLTPRLIAIQGIGFTPIELAIQGLLAELKKEQEIIGGGGNKSKGSDYRAYVDSLNRDYERQSRIRKDDQLATEFIMALVQMEILHG